MARPQLCAIEMVSATTVLQVFGQKSVKAKLPRRVEDIKFSETLDQSNCQPDLETKATDQLQSQRPDNSMCHIEYRRVSGEGGEHSTGNRGKAAQG